MTLAVLEEKGYSDLTVDEVAERTKVAKTTIYRRWPSKGALVAAAMSTKVTPFVAPDTGSLEGDLLAVASRAHMILSGDIGRIFAGLIGESQLDPDLQEIMLTTTRQRRQVYEGVVKRAIERGEVSSQANAELLIDMVVGAMWNRLLITRAPLPDSLPQEVVRMVLNGVRPR
ncbi:MAG TPA: TetR/AcrR family transcriptional regulator [Thermoanaerobaculia bacterium]|nr:TetR/AcrR family transcriptional regulator [Thermoanaerobaculia bacterium]